MILTVTFPESILIHLLSHTYCEKMIWFPNCCHVKDFFETLSVIIVCDKALSVIKNMKL